ncbi:MAG: hypothetical protein ACOCPM_03850 [Bacteroidales bacterium]
MQQELIQNTEYQLNQFSDRQKVLKELMRQVNKDFSDFLSKEITAEEKLTAELIVERLTPVLKTLQNGPYEQLRQLLYKIDMEEGKLFQQLQGEDIEEHPRIMVWSILERELKKVVTRIHFSGNK